MNRRSGDHVPILLIQSTDGATTLPPEFCVDGNEIAADAVLILDSGRDDVTLLLGAVSRLSRGAGGDELQARAAERVAGWKRERVRAHKRILLPEQLIAFSDEINRAETVDAVCTALTTHAPLVVGGRAAMLFLRDSEGATLRGVRAPGLPLPVQSSVIPLDHRFARPGLLGAQHVQANTRPGLTGLASLFSELGAASLAHVPFGSQGVLFLVERRADRVFDQADWHLLGTLAGQASAALERVRLYEEVRDLALTDPLTRLANRRRMDVVLEHSIAAARRGEGLVVAMLDLDGFKAINDTRGHPEGDRVLCAVADALREEARGSDLVVRYGGDEFLLVLPGGNAAGVWALITRVRMRLAGMVEISAGVAEYGSGTQSAEQLIDDADRDLYASRQARGTGTMPRRAGSKNLPRKRKPRSPESVAQDAG
jgi:diguanylate cyclase (GGDEF)-like protein